MTEQIISNYYNPSNEQDLNVGQKFNDYQQLSTNVNSFCKQHYHPFVIRTRSEKQVLYKCCHGVRQASRGQGKRPNQHYYYNNCPAQINFYKGKGEKWTLTKIILDHNHVIGKEAYGYYGKVKKMNENRYNTVTDLLIPENGIITNVLNKKKRKKLIKNKDSQNFRKKLFPVSKESEKNNLMEFLTEIEEDNGVYVAKKHVEEVNSLYVAASRSGDTNSHFSDKMVSKDFHHPNKILWDQGKFNAALAISKNIAGILSNYGTQTFNKYLDELRIIEMNARNGVSLFVTECSEISAIEPEVQIRCYNNCCSSQSN